MPRRTRGTWIALALLLLAAAAGPAHGRSTLAALGRALDRGVQACRAGLKRCGDGLRQTSGCVDLFAGTDLPRLLDLHAGAALKLSLPSCDGLKRAHAEGRRPRLLYAAAGVSNSLAFAGYNPLFGGWNASYLAPVRSGFGAGLFAGGPYTGFFVNTPLLLSLGGWVASDEAAPPDRPPPEAYAAITLAVPGLSHLGLACGLRLWIFSPLLRPLVRPLARPVWWLHERRLRLRGWIGRRLRRLVRGPEGQRSAAGAGAARFVHRPRRRRVLGDRRARGAIQNVRTLTACRAASRANATARRRRPGAPAPP